MFSESRCEPPPVLDKAIIINFNVSYGSIIIYKCIVGHIFADLQLEARMQCLSGSWIFIDTIESDFICQGKYAIFNCKIKYLLTIIYI